MFSLTFDQEPKEIAKRAAIIEVRVPPVTVQTVMDLLGRLGLTERIEGMTWEQDLNWITASDDTVTVSCNELSGGIQYRLRPLADEPGTGISTGEDTLAEIARGFLDRIGRPVEAQPLHLERVTYLYSQGIDVNKKKTEPVKLDAGLIFTRMIDELPVVGPGGLAMVKIGTDDTVVGGSEIWRPILQRGAKVPLRSPSEAMMLLETQLKRARIEGDYYVCKAWQCYTELGIGTSQRHLEPCYTFVIESLGNEFDTKKVVVIPAARVGPMASSFTA